MLSVTAPVVSELLQTCSDTCLQAMPDPAKLTMLITPNAMQSTPMGRNLRIGYKGH